MVFVHCSVLWFDALGLGSIIASLCILHSDSRRDFSVLWIWESCETSERGEKVSFRQYHRQSVPRAHSLVGSHTKDKGKESTPKGESGCHNGRNPSSRGPRQHYIVQNGCSVWFTIEHLRQNSTPNKMLPHSPKLVGEYYSAISSGLCNQKEAYQRDGND